MYGREYQSESPGIWKYPKIVVINISISIGIESKAALAQ
jgi:hypothetical protein